MSNHRSWFLITGHCFLAVHRMIGLQSTIVSIGEISAGARLVASIRFWKRVKLGFSFHRRCVTSWRLLRICCGPLIELGREGRRRSRFTGKTSSDWIVHRASWSCSSRVSSVFVGDLYIGLPRITAWTSWDLTGHVHKPFSRGETTNHLGVWPTANRISCGPTIIRVDRHASSKPGDWHSA